METMTRRSADNEYLHRDFHGALSCGIQYLEDHYGVEAVRDYLRTFSLSFYAPLRAELTRRGLVALEKHFERIYGVEGGDVSIRRDDDELVIEVKECPAVAHMRQQGIPVARLFGETTRAVNEALCEGSSYAAELRDYDAETGACTQRFYRLERGGVVAPREVVP